jgi:hypothetical protein
MSMKPGVACTAVRIAPDFRARQRFRKRPVLHPG